MANEAIIHDTTTALARARAAVIARLGTARLMMDIGTAESKELATLALRMVDSCDLDELIAAAKAEGARIENKRLLDLRAESGALAAEQYNV